MNTSIQTLKMGATTIAPTLAAVASIQVPETYIDKIEVAKRLGKTVRCIDNWMKRGLIPFFKIGRTVSFKWSDVEAHLSEHCRGERLSNRANDFIANRQ